MEDWGGKSPIHYESTITTTYLRPVDVYGYVLLKKQKMNKPPKNEIKKIGNGLFHCFGTEHEEYPEDGIGNYPVAVIEMPNGQVISKPVELIIFTDVQEVE